jgi:hypothetical protein
LGFFHGRLLSYGRARKARGQGELQVESSKLKDTGRAETA